VTRLAHAEDVPALTALVSEIAAGRPAGPLEWRVWTRAGAWRQVESVPANLLDDPAIGKIVLTTRDIREQNALRAEVAQAGLRDIVTGLPNRLLFQDRVSQALAAARRSGEAVAVLHLNVDDFKRINASLGWAAGDRVLLELGRRLKATLRAADTVARVGGDEFSVLLDGNGAPERAIDVADRVREGLLAPMDAGDVTLTLTATMGIASSKDSPDIDPAALLRNASVAVAAAQRHGHDQVLVFEPSMSHDVDGRLELERDLRHAVEANELVLEYQPIVDLRTREIHGAEALVRWNHPARGRLAPSAFIPLAEEIGLIGAIGTWVLRTACVEVARWAQAAPGRVPRVSVNLAAPQVVDPQLSWIVQSALAGASAAPSWLTLEVTESLLVHDTADVLKRLDAIRALGVTISIDDFGTGYSSLSYLQRFPLNTIKIDKSFVAPLDETKLQPGLAGAIIEIARALGMTTIAEGIESEIQLEHLRAMGCKLGQGFLFSRPLDADRMLALIAAAAPLA
jgi:diguanylate cyclase (GGDEF)-like protein